MHRAKKTRLARRQATAETRTSPRERKRPKIVFVCYRGEFSETAVRSFRAFLKERGLAGKLMLSAAGIDTTPERMKGADIVVSPLFSRSPGISLPEDTRRTRKLLGQSKTQVVYLKNQGYFDLPRTFEAILKQLGIKPEKKA